ncbi:Uncharacterized protein K02A2.6 [Stylophora pistillata]|uniref:Uncharacterized protein K02A2.6 n=1 Tax=Stylophora pistillata TaxID=50429 RepID=A0A2B4S2J8_STYPI|nr:Uncharacterized protein K02A2.6 [Stylophora pistillata]
MGVLVYQDNDHQNKPETGTAPVYAVQAQDTVLSKEELVTKFPKGFTEGVGNLDGEYKIRLDPTVQPVQHAPRRVAVALQPKLKETLDDLVTQEVIAPLTESTEWISSIVVAPKKNGQLQVCLDPKDRNCAIQREKYEMPMEDIATRLHGAKVFTVLDVRNGLWHISLDEQSSYLTTFQTPFGLYRWRCMPFGISSAPEVFQHKMYELIEGLTGIEWNVCLNPEKIKLQQSEVLFIGHMASNKGLQVNPAKVRAMTEMPVPTDKAAVQRLLGLAQYLAKFFPHLSDITMPLQDLTQRDVDWVWGSTHQAAFEKLKEAVTKTPVLRYHNLKEEVTLQCDASQSGLGDEMMFKGQQLVVPTALRRELLEKTHALHVGIEGCICGARDTLYWPRMSTEIWEYIRKCDICMAHSKGQAREPMMQHDFMARPWSKVAADLCDLDRRTLLVVSDYYSNYIDVALLSSTTSPAIIKELKAIFASLWIPDYLVTDNGPQLSTAEFSVFAKTWMFEHRSSSPSYAQSNGKAENAVQTIKRLFTKCKASGVSEFQALLD